VTSTGEMFACDSCASCNGAALGIADWCRAQGGGSGGSDGGLVDLMSFDLPQVVVLTGTYNVSNAMTVKDGCKISPLATSVPLVNDGTSLSIGHKYDNTTSPVQFSPAGYTLGTGPYRGGSSASLQLSTMATLSDGCSYMRDDTTTVTVLGTNMLAVDWTHRDSNYGTYCTTIDEAPTDPCTTEFKFNLGM
jgi:hypothetical protein